MDVNPILIPIIFVSSIPIIAIGLPLARAYAARLGRMPMTPTIPLEVAARLERMEQAIDSIAVEVERISEGQRFTTKLLAERTAPLAVPALPDIR
ncbi:MAG: hypothetical protein JWL61_2571 [Gemmatimonadetes bacterium]|jgi:hypothetical protein|nr:hypothetical protein [Gemmatimonadota bacterium]